MKHEEGLTVRPTTNEDKLEIENLLIAEGYYFEFNKEFNEFDIPEQNLNALENELEKLFIRNGVSASFSTF